MGTLLIFFAFMSGILGAGWVLARVIGYQRVGFTTALLFAGLLIATLAWAMPFGWHVRVGDLAIVGLVFELGALAVVLRGRPGTADTAYRWFDMAMLVVIGLIFLIPALVLPVPLDTDAQGFGYLALTARFGGDLATLAPFQPEVEYLYAPGFTVLVAYFSERLHVPLHSTQFALGASLSLLFVLVMYDFGYELGGRVRARAHTLAAVIGTGLFTAYMDAHYTTLLGLVFGAAFLAYVYRFVREGGFFNAFAAAVCLAGLVLAHPDTTIIIAIGYGPWLLLMPLARPHVTPLRWALLVFGVPLGALVFITPWMYSIAHLLGSEIVSPFSRDINYWRVALGVPPEILYQGGIITLLAIFGAVVGLRTRDHAAFLSLGWMILILDFAAFGLLDRWLPWLVAPIIRYDYPFSIAWHGPIVPLILLAGLCLVWLWENVVASRFSVDTWRHLGYGTLALIALGAILGGVFNREILALSKGRVTFFGAFASHADVAAMTWLRENAAPEARILNFPGPQEGDWVPVIAERESIYYRPQPFFLIEGDPLDDTPEQLRMRAFWEDPANQAALLSAVDYVIVPQVVGNPASFATHFRWQPPFTELIEMRSRVEDTPGLQLVFEQDGAQVFAVQD